MGWCLIAATADTHWMLGWLTNLWLFAQVAMGLGFVIFVHELGHFLAAKSCGVKCEKFYVGFDVPINLGLFRVPASLFKFQWGETEYGIGAIPLGGYVKMLGQDDNPQAAEEESARTKIEQPDGEIAIDPRSYTAKSVPQRMFIISAGVIMNLIFAVIMAAVAYMLGVSYMPAQVGATLPGSPAWVADMPIDSQIVQIGEDSYRSEQLRWDKDLMIKVLLNGPEEDMTFVIKTPGSDKEQTLVLRPQTQADRKGHPAIGILQSVNPVVSMEFAEALGHFTAFQATPALKTDDRIIAIDGEPVTGFHDIQRIWATRGSQPLTLTVERKPEDAKPGDVAQVLDSVVPPNPARELGLAMKIGPISELGIQMNSPAAEAGLKPGDEIIEINGEPAGDAMGLAEKLIPLAGQTIDVTVLREGKPKTFSVKSRQPRMAFDAMTTNAAVAIDALGVAFHPTNIVESVAPGSPAAKAGMQTGDVLKKVQFTAKSAKEEQIEAMSVPRAGKFNGPFREPTYLDTVELGDEGYNWPLIYTRMQRSQPETLVNITYERGDKILETKDMLPVASKDTFLPTRGFVFREISRTHQVGFMEAWPLGFRATKEGVMEVFTVLSKLFTGQLSPTNLAGLPGIVAGATSEASQGFGRLLMFLTFLSCNLAVLNFLPIPVLDGGHMVFLLVEGLRGKPVDERLQMNLTFFGLILLLGLMVFVFALDIGRLAGIAGMMMFFGL